MLAYAERLISEAHCAIGAVAPRGAHKRGTVVLTERPRAGARTRAGEGVSLQLGPRPQGCASPHFHLDADTAELRVWTEVLPLIELVPHSEAAQVAAEPVQDYVQRVQACAAPRGAARTIWSEYPGYPGEHAFGGLKTAGRTIAYIETSTDQYGSTEALYAYNLERDWDRLSSLTGNGASTENCLLNVEVNIANDGGGPPGEGHATTFPVGLGGYAIDASGDVAWIQDFYSGLRTLRVLTSHSSAVANIEEGAPEDLGLGAELTWTSGGEPHSRAIASIP